MLNGDVATTGKCLLEQYSDFAQAVKQVYSYIVEIHLKDGHGIVFQNPKSRGLVETSRVWNEVLNKELKSWLCPTSWEIAQRELSCESFYNLINSGEHNKILELSYHCKDGRTVWAEIMVTVISREEKKLLLTARDINEQRTMLNSVRLFVNKNCDYFVCLDVKNNHYQMYRGKLEASPMLPMQSNNYDEAVSDFIEKYVCFEDQERVTKEISREYMLQKLDKEEEYTVSYGLIDSAGRYLRKRIQCMNYDKENMQILLIRTDVTELFLEMKRQNRQLEDALRLAQIDPLTGLWNHQTITRLGRNLFAEGKEGRGALLFVDLDNFKGINDQFGHAKGDQILRFVASSFRRVLPETKNIGRVGGDEFVILLPEVFHKGEVEQYANRLCNIFLQIEDKDLPRATCSIGIACFPEDGYRYDQLYEKADQAMYEAKTRGKSGYSFWNATNETGRSKLEYEKLLKNWGSINDERQLKKIICTLRSQLNTKDRELKRLQECDRLTGLSNRQAVEAYINDLIDAREKTIGVLVMDFDSFKAFNMTYGYWVGDIVLSQFGDKLRQCIPENLGMAGRLNSELFLVALQDASEELLWKTAEEIFNIAGKLEICFPDQGQMKASLSLSIGGALRYKKSSNTTQEFLWEANAAMQKAKSKGKNRYLFYRKDQEDLFQQCLASEITSELRQELTRALEKGEFEPFYQPLYRVNDKGIACAEALARWRHPIRGILEPDKFIPLMENNSLILRLDFKIFEESCKNIRRWCDEGLDVVPICCNFSRLHFMDSGFAKRLNLIAAKYRVDPSNLGIEITENILLENSTLILHQLEEIRNLGFSVEMDDFGSGYSSFGMLQALPFDTIKLDRMFLQRDMSDFKNTSIICSIVNIAKTLGVTVVCEGVETEGQVAFLKSIFCDLAQGFYYARPMECADFEKKLMKEQLHVAYMKQLPDLARSFAKHALDEFFILQDMDAFLEYADPVIVWKDVFIDNIVGIKALKEHFQKHIYGRKLSLIYRQMTPHREDKYLFIRGEAVLCDETEEEAVHYNFYFSANCRIKEGQISLSKLCMDQLMENGYGKLMYNHFASTSHQATLNETVVLDPYYSMLPIGIVRYDLSGDMLISYMNDEIYKIIGYTKEQFQGELSGNLRAIVHPDDLNLIYDYSRRSIEGETLAPLVYRMVRRDNSITRVLYCQSTLQGIDGRSVAQSMYIQLDRLDDLKKIGYAEGLI